MLAKSNVNGVKCTTEGDETCTAASKDCCPRNDEIYHYLHEKIQRRAGSETAVEWNFDRIFVAPDGEPVSLIMEGQEPDEEVEELLDGMLECFEEQQIRREMVAVLPLSSSVALLPLVGTACAVAIFSAWSIFKWRRTRQPEVPNNYVHLVA
eukprot:gnl/TRDRNA2_/TRDRNA2_66913_c1_seq1.p1 gnl/TRDRNA2_/TRDRNA2_66913_c1~~gnl/TRDRNA2_/TRDRNA2_66913_c1_seq1.p1  ORF type:complete len:152 (+),score=29.22 gnl/TRDRNA2_/TRDRNA2_66913_c1_seq1:248-703(+)